AQTVELMANVTATPVAYQAPSVSSGSAPVTTACSPPSGSMFNVGSTAVSCTATDSLQRTDACAFIVTVLPPPTLSVTRFVAFGDSITRGEDGRNSDTSISRTSVTSLRFYPRVYLPDSQTYPGVLRQSLANRYRTQTPTVDNQGQPGEAITESRTFPRFV